MIIAVDGSASGKGTLAKRLAAHYDLAHLDTGALYRCLALHPITEGRTATNVTELEAAGAVGNIDLLMRRCSPPSAPMPPAWRPSPRCRLSDEFRVLQRQFATQTPNRRGAVLDGRDIGSVILPDADFNLHRCRP